jgi:hypothetical protein
MNHVAWIMLLIERQPGPSFLRAFTTLAKKQSEVYLL